MPDELDQLPEKMANTDVAPQTRRIHIAPKDVPPFVRRLRKMLEQQVRVMRAHPNTEPASIAATKRDIALRVVGELRPQVDDAMQRAEISGLITYYGVVA